MAGNVSKGDTAFSNISAATAAFTVAAGQYGIDVMATWGGGTVNLQKLAGDGSTYISVSTYSANTYETQNLAPGTYRFNVTTATAVYIQFASVVYA